MTPPPPLAITRTQTGVRMDRRLLAVLEALAEGRGLGRLIEDMVLHAFAGARAFSTETRTKVRTLKQAQGMDFDFPDQAAGQPHDDGRGRPPVQPDRIQAGFRLESRLLKVLKALAEREDMALGELLEEIAYHQLAGADAFRKPTRTAIALLEQVYGLSYDIHDAERFVER